MDKKYLKFIFIFFLLFILIIIILPCLSTNENLEIKTNNTKKYTISIVNENKDKINNTNSVSATANFNDNQYPIVNFEVNDPPDNSQIKIEIEKDGKSKFVFVDTNTKRYEDKPENSKTCEDVKNDKTTDNQHSQTPSCLDRYNWVKQNTKCTEDKDIWGHVVCHSDGSNTNQVCKACFKNNCESVKKCQMNGGGGTPTGGGGDTPTGSGSNEVCGRSNGNCNFSSNSNITVKSISKDIKILDWNIYNYILCSGDKKKNWFVKMIDHIKDKDIDFLTTQEWEKDKCDERFFIGKLKEVYFKRVGNFMGDSNIFYNYNKWEIKESCRLPTTFNKPKNGGNGDRNFIISIFKRKNNNEYFCLVSGHLCIAWDDTDCRTNECGNRGGAPQARVNDLIHLLKMFNNIKKKYINIPIYCIGDFNILKNEKRGWKKILDENNYKIPKLINFNDKSDLKWDAFPFDFAFTNIDNVTVKRINPGDKKYGIGSDHFGFYTEIQSNSKILGG